MHPEFDDRDAEILKERQAEFDKSTRPRCGDYVLFSDGVVRRISHIWDYDDGWFQSSDGGSWYLGKGWASFSGSLFSSLPLKTLTLTDDHKNGHFWFFHHDWHEAHNGVQFQIPCRVWQCSQSAND